MSNPCLRLQATLENLETLRIFVVENALRAGLDERKLRRIELVLEEATVNIICHAYGEHGGKLELCCMPVQGGFEVRLVDEGPPFNPLEYPDVSPVGAIGSQRVGGMGIRLMRSLSDGLHYCREEERNVLTLRFLQRCGEGP